MADSDDLAEAEANLAEAGLAPTEAPKLAPTFAPTDARAAMEQILLSIEAAETLDAILSAGELDDVEAILDRPLMLHDWSWRRSEKYGQPYFILKVSDVETGEASTVACGGEIVAFQLARMEKLIELGTMALPIDGLKMIARDTSNGYRVLKFVQV